MDIKKIREANLRQLIAESGGKIGDFADIVETDRNYISQILSEKHSASVGHSLARRIEKKFHRPNGWMDSQHGIVIESRDLIREEPPKYGAQPKITKELAIEVARRLKGPLLQDWLDADAQEAGNMLYLLINAYGEVAHDNNKTEAEGRDHSA